MTIETGKKTEDMKSPAPLIGVFDSGVGGLSVLRALWAELPQSPTLYLADQAHVPYGQRPLEQVRAYAVEISRWLMEQGAVLIVLACNAASAAALHPLREIYPNTPFVGMEPAIKPAAEQTRSGAAGVLATPATFQGALYASVVERFANGVRLLQDACPGLVEQIEAGQRQSPRTRAILEQALQPMLEQEIDTVVLGCTHYPFVIPLIQEICGPQVRVIDPAPAVARQARRILAEKELINSGQRISKAQSKQNPAAALARFYTTGEPEALQNSLIELLGVKSPVAGLQWVNDKLVIR